MSLSHRDDLPKQTGSAEETAKVEVEDHTVGLTVTVNIELEGHATTLADIDPDQVAAWAINGATNYAHQQTVIELTPGFQTAKEICDGA